MDGKTETVERYSTFQGSLEDGISIMVPDPEGDWVRYYASSAQQPAEQTVLGMPVVVDASLPPGYWELRAWKPPCAVPGDGHGEYAEKTISDTKLLQAKIAELEELREYAAGLEEAAQTPASVPGDAELIEDLLGQASYYAAAYFAGCAERRKDARTHKGEIIRYSALAAPAVPQGAEVLRKVDRKMLREITREMRREHDAGDGHFSTAQVLLMESTRLRAALSAAPAPPAHDDARADEIVSALYRKFKEWSKRDFSADDVTWCEVRAEINALIELHHPAPPAQAKENA